MSVETEKTSFWRYIVALLLLWFATMIVSVATNFILTLLNSFTPRNYTRGVIEITALANAAGVAASCYFAYSVLGKKHEIFCVINCFMKIIVNAFAVYSAIATPEEYTEPYYGAVAFIIAYGVAIFILFKVRKAKKNKSEFPTD